MATAIKVLRSKRAPKIITTNYSENFTNHINRNGRPRKDFEKISDVQLKKCIEEKIKLLKSYKNRLNYIVSYNTFNCFVTLRGINKTSMKKFLDRIRKADKGLKYLSLASWSQSLDLHYHILLYTNLTRNDLKKKTKDIKDFDIQSICSIDKLLRYFKKNVNFDTIHILQQDSSNNDELRTKQIEILKYGKTINVSTNIEKQQVIRNPSNEELTFIRRNKLVEEFCYKRINSNVKVERYLII